MSASSSSGNSPSHLQVSYSPATTDANGQLDACWSTDALADAGVWHLTIASVSYPVAPSDLTFFGETADLQVIDMTTETPISIAIHGAGVVSGTFTSQSPNAPAPSGRFGDCLSSCTRSIPKSFLPATLTLTGHPSGNGLFSGWDGACASASGATCTLQVSSTEAISVGATFGAGPIQVHIGVGGAGGGSVSTTPGSGPPCTGGCDGTFAAGTTITFTAAPAAGATFVGWRGDCAGAGTNLSCTLTPTGNVTLGAIFALAPESVAITKSGPGSGSITSNPDGVDCGVTCTATFAGGTSIVLTAMSAANSTFAGWTGACAAAGTTPQCTLATSGPVDVGATFDLAPVRVTVAVLGTGHGAVRSEPAGIDCGAACAADFAVGQKLRLDAIPAAGSTFAGWAGACAGTTPTCLVTVGAPVSVTATFAPAVMCRVPRVVGLTVAAARRAVTRAHCALGAVMTRRRSSAPAGRIVRQAPAAGTVTASGTKVAVVVARAR